MTRLRRNRTYARLMSDAAFHARNARRSLEQAQAKAPEQQRDWFDGAIGVLDAIRQAASRRARDGAVRGGIRQVH